MYAELAKITTDAMNTASITSSSNTVTVAQALVTGGYTVAYVSSTGSGAETAGSFTAGNAGNAITFTYSVAKDGSTVTMTAGVVVTIDCLCYS